MRAERSCTVNGNLIEEYYWAGKMVVYVNHRRFDGSYEDAVKQCGLEGTE